MAERTTVRLPGALVGRAKRKAAAEGRSLTSLIEEGLRRVVNERAGEHGAGRVLSPVSTATGGPVPGIDFDDTAALQGAEDRDYARRLR